MVFADPFIVEEVHTEIGHAAEEKSGLPQFDFSTYSSQLAWLALTMLVLYIIVSRIALPKVSAVLQEREEQIASDLDVAKRQRAEAEQAREACDKVLAKARIEAKAIVEAAKAEVQATLSAEQAKLEKKLGGELDAAEKRIAAAKSTALDDVSAISVEIAGQLIGTLTSTDADAKTVEQAVQAAKDARIGR